MSRLSKGAKHATKQVTNEVKKASDQVSNAAKDAVKYPTRTVSGVGTMGLSTKLRSIGGRGSQNTLDSFDKLYTVGSGAVLAAGGISALGAGAGGAGAAGAGAGGTGAAGAGLGTVAGNGGLPLMTKILLGADVGLSLAAFFGRKKGPDFQKFYNGLNSEDQAQIDQLQKNLTEIQSNTAAREKAVSDITDQYPHIMASNLQELSKTLGPQMDDVTQKIMSQTADTLAAKYNASGGFNSGAFNEGLAKESTGLASDRLNYLLGDANQQYAQRYNEANAALGFQRKMLGDTTSDIFNANQNRLNRLQGQANQNQQTAENRNNSENQATSNLFGNIGTTIGDVGLLYAMRGGGSGTSGNGGASSGVPAAPKPTYSGGGFENPYG